MMRLQREVTNIGSGGGGRGPRSDEYLSEKTKGETSASGLKNIY